ncbi:hypothetical protein HUJ04_001317 [Dendroctonus ponderosae]|nr:hypothetical protein HUJ04_001317 [Dendroctonus ponderosae]
MENLHRNTRMGCQCLVFSSTYGKGTGIFKSPDYPTPYSPNIDCLLYSFVAGPEELAKITFEEFDVYGEKTEEFVMQIELQQLPGIISTASITWGHIKMIDSHHVFSLKGSQRSESYKALNQNQIIAKFANFKIKHLAEPAQAFSRRKHIFEPIYSIEFKLFRLFKTNPEVAGLDAGNFGKGLVADRCLRGDYVKVFVHLDSARINEYTPWESVYCGNIADLPTVIYSSGPALVLEFHSGSRTNNSLGFIGQFTFEDKLRNRHKKSLNLPRCEDKKSLNKVRNFPPSRETLETQERRLQAAGTF